MTTMMMMASSLKQMNKQWCAIEVSGVSPPQLTMRRGEHFKVLESLGEHLLCKIGMPKEPSGSTYFTTLSATIL